MLDDWWLMIARSKTTLHQPDFVNLLWHQGTSSEKVFLVNFPLAPPPVAIMELEIHSILKGKHGANMGSISVFGGCTSEFPFVGWICCVSWTRNHSWFWNSLKWKKYDPPKNLFCELQYYWTPTETFSSSQSDTKIEKMGRSWNMKNWCVLFPF